MIHPQHLNHPHIPHKCVSIGRISYLAGISISFAIRLANPIQVGQSLILRSVDHWEFIKIAYRPRISIAVAIRPLDVFVQLLSTNLLGINEIGLTQKRQVAAADGASCPAPRKILRLINVINAHVFQRNGIRN